jgi:hypothetical protein
MRLEAYLNEEQKKFRCAYNWHGESYEFFTHATDEKTAKRNGVSQLAKKLKRTFGSVWNYFNSGKDNYEIEEIKE